MPLVQASGLVLSAGDAAMPAGVPIIGWHNVVTSASISATLEDSSYPAVNLANEATALEWRSTGTGAVTINNTISYAGNVDYVAIARHNFGTTGRTVTISGPGGTLVSTYTPTDDEPLIFQFTPQVLASIAIALDAGTEAARAAVVYVGKLLYCERGVDIGPEFLIPRFGRKTDVVSGRSVRGDYLGSIVLSRYTAGLNVDFKHFTPAWYRDSFDPFLESAQAHHPFFWQWSPVAYPLETAFVWLAEDPKPMTNPITSRVAVSMTLDGITE